MKLSWQRWLGAAVIVGMLATGWAVYDQLPTSVASHWNAQGQADGFSSPFWGAFGLPLLTAGLYLLLLVLPAIDPKRTNIDKFKSTYDIFALCFVLFLAYLYGLTLYYNLGRPIHFGLWLIPALSALFFAAGEMIKKAKFNYTVGIRTPWTLASAKVWDQTHRLGGDIFKLAAVFMLAGLLFPDDAFWLVMGIIIVATVYCIGYSYYLFRKFNHP